LVRLSGEITEHGRFADGDRFVRTEVLWIDHFGNVQLAATALDTVSAVLPRAGTVGLRIEKADHPESLPGADPGAQRTLRRVEAFADLAQDELGLLIDSSGYWAVVAGKATAARLLGVTPGDVVVLTW